MYLEEKSRIVLKISLILKFIYKIPVKDLNIYKTRNLFSHHTKRLKVFGNEHQITYHIVIL